MANVSDMIHNLRHKTIIHLYQRVTNNRGSA
ncbi:MAG: hypothetical protein CFE62_005510 [Candidatus Aquirickettsiella gammari]|uniref:Uncharacterized protein n=1 Tax=Candidatus Aquirickettsiella gammari TaxID=2016198 RepID=A0A370CI24_9COXI|nr:MAG: hypothetical protein CFE62_005510 [Candidatus Aquirickettsiella gammari]